MGAAADATMGRREKATATLLNSTSCGPQRLWEFSRTVHYTTSFLHSTSPRTVFCGCCYYNFTLSHKVLSSDIVRSKGIQCKLSKQFYINVKVNVCMTPSAFWIWVFTFIFNNLDHKMVIIGHLYQNYVLISLLILWKKWPVTFRHMRMVFSVKQLRQWQTCYPSSQTSICCFIMPYQPAAIACSKGVSRIVLTTGLPCRQYTGLKFSYCLDKRIKRLAAEPHKLSRYVTTSHTHPKWRSVYICNYAYYSLVAVIVWNVANIAIYVYIYYLMHAVKYI